MQDIRKPYTRSRSSENLESRLERFSDARAKSRSYYEDEEEAPVRIPVRGSRRAQVEMDVRPRTLRKEEDVDWQDEDPYRAPAYRDIRTNKTKRKNNNNSLFFGVGVAVLFVGIVLYTFVFDKATVVIVPKYKDIQDYSRVIPFSKDGSATSSVPYVVEKVSLNRSKSLPRSETKKVESKASGKAIIYNNFDSSPQKLIKNTRFESKEGKIYRINDSVTVPGISNGAPGKVEVTLYADSTGSDYNVTATEFTIPGFKGSPRYTAFSAKTNGAITGGSSGTQSLVSLADINAAKDALALELERDLKVELSKISKEGKTSLVSAAQVVYEDNEKELLTGGGEVYKVTATGYVMLADSSKLAEVVASSLLDYNREPVRLSYLENVSFVRRESDSIVTDATIPILIEGKPRVVWATDGERLRKTLLGKDTNEFREIMKSISSIESAEINFSPMWLSSFPTDVSKITVVESLPKR